MRSIIAIFSFLLSLLCLSSYSHLRSFFPGKSDLEFIYLYFLDLPSLLSIVFPLSIFFFLFKPKKELTEDRNTWEYHLDRCGKFSLILGSAAFAFQFSYCLGDMRPETIGPNLSIMLLPMFYAFIFELIFHILRTQISFVDKRPEH